MTPAPSGRSPGRAEVHLWRLTIDPTARSLDALLDHEERSRADRFAFARDRAQFVTTRATLRTLLGRYLDTPPTSLRFDSGPHGKPRLRDHTGLAFNVSHSGNRALLAFATDREIGVDIEAARPAIDLDDLARSSFSAPELARFRAAPAQSRTAAFYRFWTGKEAYIKAMGGGLSIPLDHFAVGSDGDESRCRAVAFVPELPTLTIEWLEEETGYAGAVAAAGDDWRIVRCDLANS